MSFASDNLTQERLRIVSLLIPVIFLILITRLFYWQIIRGPEMKAKASRQHETIITLKARRGNILDTEGGILAGSKNLYHLFVYKPQLKISENELVGLLLKHLQKTDQASTEAELKQFIENKVRLKTN